jgi:hypothetical protein
MRRILLLTLLLTACHPNADEWNQAQSDISQVKNDVATLTAGIQALQAQVTQLQTDLAAHAAAPPPVQTGTSTGSQVDDGTVLIYDSAFPCPDSLAGCTANKPLHPVGAILTGDWGGTIGRKEMWVLTRIQASMNPYTNCKDVNNNPIQCPGNYYDSTGAKAQVLTEDLGNAEVANSWKYPASPLLQPNGRLVAFKHDDNRMLADGNGVQNKTAQEVCDSWKNFLKGFWKEGATVADAGCFLAEQSTTAL